MKLTYKTSISIPHQQLFMASSTANLQQITNLLQMLSHLPEGLSKFNLQNAVTKKFLFPINLTAGRWVSTLLLGLSVPIWPKVAKSMIKKWSLISSC